MYLVNNKDFISIKSENFDVEVLAASNKIEQLNLLHGDLQNLLGGFFYFRGVVYWRARKYYFTLQNGKLICNLPDERKEKYRKRYVSGKVYKTELSYYLQLHPVSGGYDMNIYVLDRQMELNCDND